MNFEDNLPCIQLDHKQSYPKISVTCINVGAKFDKIVLYIKLSQYQFYIFWPYLLIFLKKEIIRNSDNLRLSELKS